MRFYFLFLFGCFFPACFLHAQSALSLQACEQQFLQKNLQLLAEQYNIEAAKAQIVQAKLWENPYIFAELNAANPQDKKAFNIEKNGQKALAVQQLIFLGGKKKNEVELARANAATAEYAFTDLLRNLRFQLRTNFFAAYYDKISVTAIDKQLSHLDSLIQSYSVQVQKGNIPLKDLVRLQSLYMSLKNDRTELIHHLLDEQQTLRVLLSADANITPAPTDAELNKEKKTLPATLDFLQNTAISNRSDVALATKNIEAAHWNLKWQRSLSVPDLTIGASYDQRGGAFNNQVNLTLGMPLRLWNKNQGNIKTADAQVLQAGVLKEQLLIQLRCEVYTAYQKYLAAVENYQLLKASLHQNFDEVYKGIYQNFQRRNITLIEFTDFMESYNQSLIQFNQIRKALTHAQEEINYATGTTLF